MNQKMRAVVAVAMTSVSMLLTGCVSTQAESDKQASIKVAPVSTDYKLEITLAKLNEILASVELTPEAVGAMMIESSSAVPVTGVSSSSPVGYSMMIVPLSPEAVGGM